LIDLHEGAGEDNVGEFVGLGVAEGPHQVSRSVRFHPLATAEVVVEARRDVTPPRAYCPRETGDLLVVGCPIVERNLDARTLTPKRLIGGHPNWPCQLGS